MKGINPDKERVQRDIKRIAQIVSPEVAGYTRISFSKEDREAREHVTSLMRNEAKLSVRIDAAGNIIGRSEGKNDKPAILVGSHIDTVQAGGRFDGVAGVVAAIEVARRIHEEGIQLEHPIEVVVFLAEEPSPFGMSAIGSRAMVGKLPEDLLFSLHDRQGRSLGMAIDEMGGNALRIGGARRSSAEVQAFLELHIEQGPVLFSKGISIGVVTGIVGICRGKIEMIGQSDHSGTTPMDLRKDALSAASEVVLALEEVCRNLDGVVGTIGKVNVFPNSLNVIPGRVHLGMEVRSRSELLASEAIARFKRELDQIIQRRRIQINFEAATVSEPVVFHPGTVELLVNVCNRLDIRHLQMISGAGHDAGNLADIAPTGMIFIPSRDGRSHCPEEWTSLEDLRFGTKVLGETIIALDKEGQGNDKP